MKNHSSATEKKRPTKGQRLGWKPISERESLNTRQLLDKDTKIRKPEKPSGGNVDSSRFLIP